MIYDAHLSHDMIYLLFSLSSTFTSFEIMLSYIVGDLLRAHGTTTLVRDNPTARRF